MMSPAKNVLAGLLALAISACNDNAQLPAIELSGNSMGTSFSIVLIDPAPEIGLHDLKARLESRLGQIEKIASTYQDTSDISKFNIDRSTEWISVSSEFCAMVSEALRIGQETGGAFDITVAPSVNLWGFGPVDFTGAPPAESEIDLARETIGYGELEVDCDRPAIQKSKSAAQIDLSGWAKGYAVDQLALLLELAGVDNFFVELGGELKVRGHNAENRRFAIAIEKPQPRPTDQYSLIHITDAGIATSGTYRNFFEHDGKRYSHTIDPYTGRPVDHHLSTVTVIHNSTARADALATALLVLGPDEGMAFANRQAISAYFAVSTESGFEYRSSDAFLRARYFLNDAN